MQKLTEDHEKGYEKMRSFFNTATADSLDLIKKLKADLSEAKHQQSLAEAHASAVSQENKQLVEPLALVRAETSQSALMT